MCYGHVVVVCVLTGAALFIHSHAYSWRSVLNMVYYIIMWLLVSTEQTAERSYTGKECFCVLLMMILLI